MRSSRTEKRGRLSSWLRTKKLGIKVQTGIAHTGVLGILKGGLPGRTIACARTWTDCRSRSSGIAVPVHRA